ncbi:hypothetical protein TNCV_4677341 [Trichonephila clavipes]|nr:hypothetical protein TNCV_4677341 [Trichonephila clavipes]
MSTIKAIHHRPMSEVQRPGVITGIVRICGCVNHSTTDSERRRIVARVQKKSGVLAMSTVATIIRAVRSFTAATCVLYTGDFRD